MPLFDTVKVGNVSVKLYKLPNKGLEYIYVKYSWSGEPKMRTIRCKGKADEQRARTLAREIAGAIYNNRANYITDMGHAARVLKSSEDALVGCNIDIDAACREYAQARQIIGKTGTVLGAAEYFAKTRGASLRAIEVRDAVEEYLAALKSDRVGIRHLQDSRSRLRQFGGNFAGEQIAEISVAQMQKWLRALEVAPRTRNNYRDSIAAMFHWAQTENYLRKDVPSEADELKTLPTPTEIHILPNEQVAELLHGAETHDPRCIHYLCFGFLAFIRPAEIMRMSDRNVRLLHNDIEILPAIAKGERHRRGRRRLIPIQPGLRAWLDAYPLQDGKLVMYKTPVFVRKLARKLKIDWKHDIMRHTGISHAVAMTQNVDQVALWAGNSRDIIYENYLNQVPEREGKLFFTAILPKHSVSDKIVRMKRA